MYIYLKYEKSIKGKFLKYSIKVQQFSTGSKHDIYWYDLIFYNIYYGKSYIKILFDIRLKFI